MNAAANPLIDDALDAPSFVLYGLARLAGRCETLDEDVRERLQAMTLRRFDNRAGLMQAFADYLRHPTEADAPLVRVADEFELDPVETIAVRLAIAAEEDLFVGHLLSHLQPPLALSRPTIGLVVDRISRLRRNCNALIL